MRQAGGMRQTGACSMWRHACGLLALARTILLQCVLHACFGIGAMPAQPLKGVAGACAGWCMACSSGVMCLI
jgi:hypothetical protein